jgi:hypothetical protein
MPSPPLVLLVSLGAATAVGCTVVVPLPGFPPDAATDDGGGVCWPVPVSREMVPPQAIVAFDRSSTMDDRIEPLRAELIPWLTILGPAVEIGFLEFPDRACDEMSCCDASPVLVPPALDTAALINAQLACPASGAAVCRPGARRTPTDDALRTIGAYWSDPGASPERFAVVITDGAPNCNGDTGAPCVRARRAAAELLASRSRIRTVILAISPATLSTCLGGVANEGGNVFRNGTPTGTPYVWIDDTRNAAAIRAALGQMLGPVRARTCVARLEAPRAQVSDVTVRVDGAVLAYDPGHGDGWDFEPSAGPRFSEVRIFGPRCDEIQAGQLRASAVQTTVVCKDCGAGADCR